MEEITNIIELIIAVEYYLNNNENIYKICKIFYCKIKN
jgi:hypothetical protein